MPLELDETTPFGARVRSRLSEEVVIWLTTVSPSGKPYPSLVWFLEDHDGTLLIYSQPNRLKLHNIASNPAVGLNFNSTPGGDNVIVFQGRAVVDESGRPLEQRAAYLEKYGQYIPALGYPPEAFFDDYSVPIRVSLERVRGF